MRNADRFERWLIDQEKLADSTVRKRCGFAKQMLQTAVDDRLIESNPLQRLKVAALRLGSLGCVAKPVGDSGTTLV